MPTLIAALDISFHELVRELSDDLQLVDGEIFLPAAATEIWRGRLVALPQILWTDVGTQLVTLAVQAQREFPGHATGALVPLVHLASELVGAEEAGALLARFQRMKAGP